MERISQLLYKRLQGTLSEAEDLELMIWVAADPANKELLNRVDNEEVLKASIRDWYGTPRRSVADDARLDAAIAQHEAGTKHTRISQLVRHLFPYAAALLIMVLAGTWYVLQKRGGNEEQGIATAAVLPGGNKASLTLADGRKLDLSADQSGIVVGDGSITYSNGSALSAISSEDQVDTRQLELTTPKGGTYQVTLSDGSKVWLNAASTIKYPSSFSDKERVVEIMGEAYFDIREDSKHPFKVRSRGQEIWVLGTKFNISAYPDEKETKTTLIDGKVRLSLVPELKEAAPTTDKPIVLQPGEQGLLRNGHITKSEVDISIYTAWKDGFFYFDRLSTPVAITQLARWYDLDVAYEGKIPNANVFAYIDRNKPLSAVLTAFEKSGLTFKVVQSGERKKLIVLGELSQKL